MNPAITPLVIDATELPTTDVATATNLSPSLELLWEAPNRKVFSEFNFKRDLFITATSFHRPFFKQNNTGIPQELYAPRLEAFSEAFKEWNRTNYGGKWNRYYYRDELSLAFDIANYVRTNGKTFSFVAVPNTEKYDPKYSLAYEFLIETETELQERADDFIADNLTGFSARSLYYNLKEGITKEPVIVDYADLSETHSTGKDYNEEECPCCFESLAEDPIMEGGFLGKCGHCVCVGCLKSLINTQRSHLVCPMCRDDWECYNVVASEEGEEYTEEDIDALRDDDDFDTLGDIVDLVGLREYLVNYYGWDEVLGESQGHQTEHNDYYYSLNEYTISTISDNVFEVF